MSVSRWIVSTALGLAAVAAILLLHFSWGIFSGYQHDHAKQRADAADYQTRTDRGAKQSQYDLQAQQDMAAWAFGMLIVTIWLTVVTLFGVFFVWQTLRATQKMARETRTIGEAQVNATNTSIDQAKVANEIAARSIREQSRPFVVAVPSLPNAHEWGSGGQSAEWKIEIQNHGPGVAFLVSANATTWTDGRDTPPWPNPPIPMFSPGFAGQRQNTVLRTGGIYTAHARGFRLTAGLEGSEAKRTLGRFTSGNIFAWLEFLIVYEDFYGTKYKTAGLFRLRHHCYTVEQYGDDNRNYRT